jgi:hypothetical protein
MFKGMSKKKGHNNKKKSTTKSDQREKKDLVSTHIGQLFQWFEDRQCIMSPYNFE